MLSSLPRLPTVHLYSFAKHHGYKVLSQGLLNFLSVAPCEFENLAIHLLGIQIFLFVAISGSYTTPIVKLGFFSPLC